MSKRERAWRIGRRLECRRVLFRSCFGSLPSRRRSIPGCAQLGMLLLQLGKLAKQAVVLRVGELRRVLDVIQAGFDPLFRRPPAPNPPPAAPWKKTRAGGPPGLIPPPTQRRRPPPRCWARGPR